MDIIWTALGVGGATVIGSMLGFFIKKPTHRLNDIILSFAAGVMLAAAVLGLIAVFIAGEGFMRAAVVVLIVFVIVIMCSVFMLKHKIHKEIKEDDKKD